MNHSRDKAALCGLPYGWLVLLLLAFIWPLTILAMGNGQQNADPGKTVYKKANCVGCHKWHGGGGGGYGGAALSLRDTLLDAEGMKLVIRCGRPKTRMPYHERGAFEGEDLRCFGITAEQLGADNIPPRARTLLRDKQIDDVVKYVMETLKGKGTPSREECIAYWGEGARQCQSM